MKVDVVVGVDLAEDGTITIRRTRINVVPLPDVDGILKDPKPVETAE